MSSLAQKKMARLKRKVRVRKKIQGTPVCPRLNVFKSAKHIYAQIIDDVSGVTMVSASTVMKDVQAGLKYTGNLDAAVKVGAAIAERARAKGIERVFLTEVVSYTMAGSRLWLMRREEMDFPSRGKKIRRR